MPFKKATIFQILLASWNFPCLKCLFSLPTAWAASPDKLWYTTDIVLQSIMVYTVGRGVNREGFNFKLAMVKTCSTWPLLNKYALKIFFFEVGLQTPPSPQTPYISPWESPKIENLNIVFAMVKMHSQEPKRNYYNF